MFASFATFAQGTKQDSTGMNSDTSKIVYTCTMHPEIVSDTPGICPKCGMKLTPMKKEQMKMEAAKNKVDKK